MDRISQQKRTLDPAARSLQARQRRQEPTERVRKINELLEASYGSADLGNKSDPIEEIIYISLTRQTHRANAFHTWRAIRGLGGPKAFLELPTSELSAALKRGGFANQKARWIRQCLKQIVATMGSLSLSRARNWNDSKLEKFLCSLPGLSTKSAKCVMLYSMNRQVLPVDTHLRRIATRVGLVSHGLSEKQIHQELEEIVSPDLRYPLHVNAIWHGRNVCKALKPSCPECMIKHLCDYGRVESGNPS